MQRQNLIDNQALLIAGKIISPISLVCFSYGLNLRLINIRISSLDFETTITTTERVRRRKENMASAQLLLVVSSFLLGYIPDVGEFLVNFVYNNLINLDGR